MNGKTIGQRIKAARQRAGLSQAELADKMGRPYQSIGQWERDISSPKFSSLEEIADALGISIEELICGDKPEKGDSEPLSNPQTPLVSVQLSPDSLRDLTCRILQDVSDNLESHDIEQYKIWRSTFHPMLEKKFSEEAQKIKPVEVKRTESVEVKMMDHPEALVPIDWAIANDIELFSSFILPASELSWADIPQYFTSKNLHMLADKDGMDGALPLLGQLIFLRKRIKGKYAEH